MDQTLNLLFFCVKDVAKLVPTTHLMSEAEWRGIGVQQSQVLFENV